MPSTEVTVDNLRRLGHEVALDDSRLAEVADHFGGLADDQGFARGAPVEYAVAAIQQQFPGGMMGTLREQLKQVGMSERLPEVLEEAIRVRSEMGWPIMATPFSQLVGIQALLNVVQGERYATIPDENLMYIAGWYGTPPGEVEPELLEKAAATARGKQMMEVGHAPQPSLKEIRAEYGENLSDEELLLRYLIPGEDVENMYRADNPIEPILPLGGPEGLPWLKDLLRASEARGVSATRGGVSVTRRTEGRGRWSWRTSSPSTPAWRPRCRSATGPSGAATSARCWAVRSAASGSTARSGPGVRTGSWSGPTAGAGSTCG
jgi:oxaloacetate decarboxylase alpha subunit